MKIGQANVYAKDGSTLGTFSEAREIQYKDDGGLIVWGHYNYGVMAAYAPGSWGHALFGEVDA